VRTQKIIRKRAQSSNAYKPQSDPASKKNDLQFSSGNGYFITNLKNTIEESSSQALTNSVFDVNQQGKQVTPGLLGYSYKRAIVDRESAGKDYSAQDKKMGDRKSSAGISNNAVLSNMKKKETESRGTIKVSDLNTVDAVSKLGQGVGDDDELLKVQPSQPESGSGPGRPQSSAPLSTIPAAGSKPLFEEDLLSPTS